jgi:tetratricopeptide (TPR) repeat protein
VARALRLLVLLSVAAVAWLVVDERRRGTPPPAEPAAAPGVAPVVTAPGGAILDPAIVAELNAIRALPDEKEPEALARYEALLKMLDGELLRTVSCELAVRLHNRAIKQANAAEERAADIDSARALELCPTQDTIKKNRAAMLASFASKEDRKTRDGRARAKELLERSLAVSERPDALALLAELLYAEDDVKGAVEKYDRALALKDVASWRERREELGKKAAVEGTFSDRRHEHFIARFEGYAQEKLAWMALDELEHAYFSIGRALDLYPNEPFTVLIYTGDQYQRAIDVPDWSSGVFDGKIRIAEGQLALAKGTLEAILRHEYTHAALSTLPAQIPTWANEGLAEHFEGADPDAARARVLKGKESGQLISWEDLNGAFVTIADKERAGLAYATAAALVGGLVSARGSYTLVTLVTQMENGASFDEAFLSTYASTPKAYFERWQSDL